MTRLYLKCSREELKQEIEKMKQEEFIDGGKVINISSVGGPLILTLDKGANKTLYMRPEELLKIINDYDLVRHKPSLIVSLREKEGDYYE